MILLLPPLLGIDARTQDSLTLALVFAIAAVGLDILSGYGGQFSIGNFAFVGIGAYATAILGTQYGWSTWATLPAAVLAPMVVAGVLGVPMMRIGQLGGAFMTFFLGYLVMLLLGVDWLSPLTNAAAGLAVPPAALGGLDLSYGSSLYYLAWALLAVTALLSARFADSRQGQALRVIKRSPVVASALGIDVSRSKVIAFVFSAGAAGLAGFVYAQLLGYLMPTNFLPAMSLTLLVMTIVGGLGSIAGPIAGAVLMTLLSQVTREAGAGRELYYAAVLIIVLIALPEGGFGLYERLRGLVRRQPDPSSTDPTEYVRVTRTAGLPSPVPREEAPNLLTVDDLQVTFGGVRALDGTSLRIVEGQIHALLGPNGAGKTTILNCISGIQPHEGSIVFDGTPLKGLRPQQIRRLGLTRTFQNPSLVGDLSVLENVQLGCYGDESSSVLLDLLPLPSTLARDARTRDAAKDALAMVGLPESVWGRPATATSLADQKLVDIARAVVSSPRMMLLDEPTAGLQDEDIESVARVLTEVNREAGLTILVIAHHVGFLRDVAHSATALHFGRPIATGTPDAVVEDSRVVDVFLGAAHVS
ncbi:ATP-binding cassette domain-containing protein [Aeromicrobium tamlense]|uniref:ATP-binding cassette domain-containing protein n=1 Tax=Aeromicrobium tamlense TaxID=375541 RepID=A0A8I0FY28_9ACTN|nr:ATP-binding cassette domain-containing protein [Aeromicrobium tamlense]MBD1270748.1 ATP-binding cassette domain-containing protein [Aeromicrobium tamlense]MBD1271120.1 ATP-binding cassette domain-containing protein [Aeromicrobium tamlense]NYI38140.1 branched-chain amino acid transport system permease protein [Aeromicrobium tamlense]